MILDIPPMEYSVTIINFTVKLLFISEKVTDQRIDTPEVRTCVVHLVAVVFEVCVVFDFISTMCVDAVELLHGLGTRAEAVGVGTVSVHAVHAALGVHAHRVRLVPTADVALRHHGLRCHLVAVH